MDSNMDKNKVFIKQLLEDNELDNAVEKIFKLFTVRPSVDEISGFMRANKWNGSLSTAKKMLDFLDNLPLSNL